MSSSHRISMPKISFPDGMECRHLGISMPKISFPAEYVLDVLKDDGIVWNGARFVCNYRKPTIDLSFARTVWVPRIQDRRTG